MRGRRGFKPRGADESAVAAASAERERQEQERRRQRQEEGKLHFERDMAACRQQATTDLGALFRSEQYRIEATFNPKTGRSGLRPIPRCWSGLDSVERTGVAIGVEAHS